MNVYTAVQLLEVVLFGGVLVYGAAAHRPSLAVLGGGLLLGKAILNILAPEGGTVIRRSVLGYSVGAVYVALGILLIKLAG